MPQLEDSSSDLGLKASMIEQSLQEEPRGMLGLSGFQEEEGLML